MFYGDSSGYQNILPNCLKNLETEAKKVLDLVNTAKERQIKDAGQLEYLAKSADFLTKSLISFKMAWDRKTK